MPTCVNAFSFLASVLDPHTHDGFGDDIGSKSFRANKLLI
jgi:hypothetical protein